MTGSEKKILNRPELKQHIECLSEDFHKGHLTLYLGAGVSRGSGLPNWNTLIATLYYVAVDADWYPKWKAYPNYLYALGEWLLSRSGESPEVATGKVASYFGSRTGFENKFKEALYLPWKNEFGNDLSLPSKESLRAGNGLLDAVAKLCEATKDAAGLHAVVTTNYDSLLEISLKGGCADQKFKPIWKTADMLTESQKGIFHVHGYLPPIGKGSPFDEIMLTEAQYHGAANDPYSWSNLTLIQCFSTSSGLMVGMSMADRNLRRLLHALQRTPLRKRQYVFLKEPDVPIMTPCDRDHVAKQAQEYLESFQGSGIKHHHNLQEDMEYILNELVRQEKSMAMSAMDEMGVTPLWVNDYSEIPVILNAIRA